MADLLHISSLNAQLG